MNSLADETVDVLIAGGGPAGLSVAQRTAAAGLRTLVVERNAGIGIPVRTSGGSFVAKLAALGVPERFHVGMHRVSVLGPGSDAHFDYARPAVCVLDVRGFFQWLGAQAIAAGATIALETRVEGMENVAGGGSVVTLRPAHGPARRVHARLVVEATGYASTLAKRRGLNPGFVGFGIGAEWDLYAPNHDPHEALLVVGEAIAPHGYGWVLPYGDGRVRLGVGVSRPWSDAEPHAYLAAAQALVPSLASASPLESHTGLIPVGPPRSIPFVKDGLMVVGDAALQSSSLIGEGIRFVIDAARMAGETIVEAARAGDLTDRGLAGYERRWRRAYGRNLRIAWAIYRRVATFTDADWRREIPDLAKLSADEFAQGLAGDFTIPWALAVARRYGGFLSPLRLILGARDDDAALQSPARG